MFQRSLPPALSAQLPVGCAPVAPMSRPCGGRFAGPRALPGAPRRFPGKPRPCLAPCIWASTPACARAASGAGRAVAVAGCPQ